MVWHLNIVLLGMFRLEYPMMYLLLMQAYLYDVTLANMKTFSIMFDVKGSSLKVEWKKRLNRSNLASYNFIFHTLLCFPSCLWIYFAVMTSGMDMLPFLDVACAECQDLGPPPDSILAIPPPPLPAFLLSVPDNHSSACGSACDWVSGHAQFVEHAEFSIPG